MVRLLAAVPTVAVSLVLLAAATGCIGSETQDPSPSNLSSPVPDPGQGPPARATDAVEPNASQQASGWIEAYWGDRDKVVLVEDTGSITRGVSIGSGPFAGSCIVSPCEVAFFRSDEGAIVAPGADAVNVTVSWSAPPTAPSMQVEFWYRAVDWGTETVRNVEDVPNGEPVTLPVNGSQTDAPLQPASHWWFAVSGAAEPAGPIVSTEVQVRIVAVRGETLPEAGPARAASNTSVEATLVDAVTHDYAFGLHPRPGCVDTVSSCDPPGPGAWWESQPGGLVLGNTTTVRATLSWDRPLPARPGLEAIYPGGRARMDLVDDPVTEMERTFEVSVPDGAVDSPWQQRSLWRFSPVFETQGQDRGVSGGAFTLTATAVRGNGTQAP